jgi:LPS-assembly lipoprotein
MKQNFIKMLVYAGFLLALAGCGFHLRGYASLPAQLHVLYVQSDKPYGALSKQLQQTLRSMGVIIAPNAQAAPLSLQILAENNSQQLTSQGVSGQLATYTLSSTVIYQLANAQGRVIQSAQTVTASRSFSMNANQVLGDTSVQAGLQSDMQRDLVYQLVNRLNSRNTAYALAHI